MIVRLPPLRASLVVATIAVSASLPGLAEPVVIAGHSADGSDGVTFGTVPAAATNDAATGAAISLVDGERDRNGGDLAVLHDGQLPTGSDQPAENFFFRAGTDGGRLALDLGKPIAVRRVGTYSWHGGPRGPQVYTLYGASGEEVGFTAAPGRNTDPGTAGWTKLAEVDTRPESGDGAGRHGVSITGGEDVLGTFRHLLFDFRRTEDRDAFGNTFLSEIDVVDAEAPEPTPVAAPETVMAAFATADGKFRFTLDAAAAPDLLAWAEKALKPVVLEWYPKIVELLPGEGFEARKEVRLLFRNDMGGIPASAGGGVVNMNADWFRRELEREARGAVVHELVHIVQEYGRGLRGRRAAPVPGWITEGIPDYIRWFLYEPQTRGAEITRRTLDGARFDASYRTSANFLDWVAGEYGPDFIPNLNAAAREGRYGEELWKEWTGKPVEELGEAWKAALAARLSPE